MIFIKFFKSFLAVTLALSVIVSCSDDSTNVNFTLYSSNESVSALVLPRALAGSPTSLNLDIYALYVSQNEDCTDAIEIFDNGNTPLEVDIYSTNTLFSGVIANGTYNCIAMKMSDNISYQVDSTAVAAHGPECVSVSTTHSGDLYRHGEADDGLFKDHEGNAIDATGSAGSPSEDRIFTFASTNPSAATSGPLNLHINQLLTLASPLVVPGSATFFADFNDGIDANGGHCALEGGVGFGFR